jgi:SAM-dependent methyltransferase
MTETGVGVLEPLAYDRIADLYDTYVNTDYDIPFFLAAAGQAAGPVLELMSGTGRVSVPLAEAGVDLTCVDASAEMLAVLRRKLDQRGLQAAVHCMDVRALALPQKYNLIFVPFQAFMELILPEDQRSALTRIRACLADDGRFICTLHNRAPRLNEIDGQLHLVGKYPLAERGETLLLWVLQQEPDPWVVEGMLLYEQYGTDGIMRAKRLFEMRYYLHSYAGFRELVETAGFAVEHVYGDYQYHDYDEAESPYMIWVLKLH